MLLHLLSGGRRAWPQFLRAAARAVYDASGRDVRPVRSQASRARATLLRTARANLVPALLGRLFVSQAGLLGAEGNGRPRDFARPHAHAAPYEFAPPCANRPRSADAVSSRLRP